MTPDFRIAIVGVVVVFAIVVAAVVTLTVFGPENGTATTVTALIGIAGVVLGPLLALVAQMQRVTKTVESVEAKVEVVHAATNSMKDELVAATGKASHAEGFIEGKAEEQQAARDAQRGHGTVGSK